MQIIINTIIRFFGKCLITVGSRRLLHISISEISVLDSLGKSADADSGLTIVDLDLPAFFDILFYLLMHSGMIDTL